VGSLRRLKAARRGRRGSPCKEASPQKLPAGRSGASWAARCPARRPAGLARTACSPSDTTQCADYTASAGNNGSRYVGHEADFLGDVGGQRVSVRLYVEEQAGQTRRWPGVHQVSAFGQADGSLQVWFVGTSTSWDRQGGSFTVAPDGRSGTVDAAAGDGPSDPLPVRAKGTWACP